MSLKQRITEDMKNAMRAKDKTLLGTIRLLTSEIKQIEVDTRSDVNDADIVKIIGKMIKQRKDAAEQYDQADRPELADIERAESEVLKAYLPQQLSEDEVQALVDDTIRQTDAQGMQDMGRVMGQLQSKIAGRADMGEVSALVKSRLS
ncbi:GatB/YqeY domain-containing protein [Marinicella gelatinilytica]|uniref:GatB/YqeY domain-containing protein n=1 Tax=Marinicella gelatinilytica TaxID=2996017 RepID=UPI00226085D7|nr:GatB/YqeY domain-containing protein [Marinicella gelatinilytica]MCX7545078.1 GatB/YqeY domain-containing protein [Marinicella gelatinilytica]